MLGLGPGGAWSFLAAGKHPLARDYLALGRPSPLGAALCKWVEGGYRPSAPLAAVGLWRFWTRGGKRGELALGLIRQSSDSMGRPYPLLVLGHGPLPDWERNWQLLTLACEKSWREMEALATVSQGEVQELERRVAGLPPPLRNWEGLRGSLAKRQGEPAPAGEDTFPRQSEEDPGLLLLQLESPIDPEGALAARLAGLSPMRPVSLPHSGFLTAQGRGARYLVFTRALRSSDFHLLWQDQTTVGTGDP